jgi:hypothetical protein
MRGRFVWALVTGAIAGLGASIPAAALDEPAPAASQADWLHQLVVEVGGEPRRIEAVELIGLRSLSPEEVWSRVGRPSRPLPFADAAAVLAALQATETFARIEPRLRVETSGLTLEIGVEEHPRVWAIVVEGLAEVPEPEVRADLLGAPEPGAGWLARVEDGTVRSGILRGGITGAVQRMMAGLFDAGYLMADASGTLSADGTLTIAVDEGRIGDVRLVGLEPRVHRLVLEEMRLPPGRTFLEADVTDALRRVQETLPFVRPHLETRPTRAGPLVRTSTESGGGTRFSLAEAPPVERPGVFTVAVRTLTLHFRPGLATRFRVLADHLLRHTPVGGIGVGVRADFKVWDPKDRAHFRVEAFSGTVDSEALDALGEEGGEFASALRVRVPALRIADVALEAHGAIDTSDDWRLQRQSSYLSSLLFGRPDAEYYWRSGSSLALTLQPARRLLVAADTRNDRFRSMKTLEKPPVVFRPDKPIVNPPIDAGEWESWVFRAELLSEPVSPEQVKGLFRSPNTSIVARPRSWDMRTGYSLFATVERAVPTRDSLDRRRFTRFVGDGMLFLATSADSGLRLRGRMAGGSSLPAHREENLGGWSALRGYDLKEFRGGDWSALGMAEYRQSWLSGFVDVGALRRPGSGWTGPHVGLGAKVHLDHLPLVGHWMRKRRFLPPLQVGFAWRLDGRGSLEPSVRLLVGDLF